MKDKKFYATIVVFLVVVFVFSYTVIQSGQRDSYTMFYFTNPREPLIFNASDSTLMINFAVENHEEAITDYLYLIRLIYQNQNVTDTTSISRRKITLNDGETIDISEKMVIEEPPGDQIKVLVELYKGGINETYRSLRYWVNVSS